jgi:MYXO-CTERM domain-containing protein
MHRSVWLSSIVLLAPLSARAVTECRPSRVQLVIDRSTSMFDKLSGTNDTKWSVASAAVNQVLHDYEQQVEFGLTMFPEEQNNCSAGGLLMVSPNARGASQTSKIVTDLNTGPFAQNGYTPIGEVLGEIPSYYYFGRPNPADPEDLSQWRRFVILLTDGHEDCPGAEMAHDAIVAKVTALKALGIKTFVIGFGRSSTGDGVDAKLLGDLAVAGGSQRMGCDPAATDPTSPKVCYYQADDSGALMHAFDEILVEVSQEICDGLDNDCNGLVDDGIPPVLCSTICGPGESVCEDGHMTECDAPQPQPEVCDDGVDNDCNGQTDEGCGCENGATQPCGTDVGECTSGHQTCTDHVWGACEGGTGPQPEICDGLDNDCDGTPDDGLQCDCLVGTTETCGPPNVGQCHSGTRTCNADGSWGPCEGAVGPTPEKCDGIDNDCDGMVDEPTRSGDDDAAQSLCLADEVCQDGACVKVPPPVVTPPNQVNGTAAGCACNTGGSGDGPLGALLLGLVAVGLVVTTRRRP